MSRNLYPSNSIELDLRSEFEKMMSGTSEEISKQQTFILRQARRDSNNIVIPCSCRDSLTLEPDTESTCPYCFGEGFYFDETFLKGYTMYIGSKGGFTNKRINIQPGLISAYDKVFYFRYNTIITYDDKIVELKLDSDGIPIVPYKRKLIFRPETIMEMRSDTGRIEFLAVYVNENNGIRVK